MVKRYFLIICFSFHCFARVSEMHKSGGSVLFQIIPKCILLVCFLEKSDSLWDTLDVLVIIHGIVYTKRLN